MQQHYLVAIIPYYDNYGKNVTYTLTSSGDTHHLDTPIRTYILRMVYEEHLDPRALQYWTHKILGTKINTPLILSDSLVFIPIKLRHKVGKSDGCFGYILSSAITNYDNHTLTLSNGITLPTLSSKSYIAKKQRDAKLLTYAYIEHRKAYEFMTK